MPYPMAHLAAARLFLAPRKIADPGAFYLGSVAPDAYRWGKAKKDLADRRRAHLADGEKIGPRFRDTEFGMGYALHLLVDLYWEDAVLNPFLRARPYGDYAGDMGVLDLILYARLNAEETILPQLAATEVRGMDGLVTPEQVDAERALTLSWYREHMRLAGEPLRGPFSIDDLLSAVDEAARVSARKWTDLFENRS